MINKDVSAQTKLYHDFERLASMCYSAYQLSYMMQNGFELGEYEACIDENSETTPDDYFKWETYEEFRTSLFFDKAYMDDLMGRMQDPDSLKATYKRIMNDLEKADAVNTLIFRTLCTNIPEDFWNALINANILGKIGISANDTGVLATIKTYEPQTITISDDIIEQHAIGFGFNSTKEFLDYINEYHTNSDYDKCFMIRSQISDMLRSYDLDNDDVRLKAEDFEKAVYEAIGKSVPESLIGEKYRNDEAEL